MGVAVSAIATWSARGDYGSVAVGIYSGHRSDQNGDPHVLARWSYPFELASGQFVEVGARLPASTWRQTQAITTGGASPTPAAPADGVTDERMALTAVWYPQPFGVEAVNVGRGPSDNYINRQSLHGGYVQVNYRKASGTRSLFPFVRWRSYDSAP